MTRFHRRRRCLLTTIMVLSVILTALCGVAQAKYLQRVTLEEQTVTITARLGTITLKEHEAVRQPDGSYVLLDGQEGRENQIVTSNTYILMPGVDVPKDPYVVVLDKSPIAAYIYIVVGSDLPATATYSLESHWIAVSGYPNVYVYAPGGTPQAVIGNVDAIPILQGNIITVSQNYSENGSVSLTFDAYMYQVIAGETPEEVYQRNNTP